MRRRTGCAHNPRDGAVGVSLVDLRASIRAIVSVSDDPLSLRSLDRRLRAIEERDIADDALHRQLLATDTETAKAVHELTETIRHPRDGLIVELDKFRAEVIADRQAFRAWIRGATFIVSIVFAIFSVLAPWLRALLETLFNVRPVP